MFDAKNIKWISKLIKVQIEMKKNIRKKQTALLLGREPSGCYKKNTFRKRSYILKFLNGFFYL